MYSGWSNRPSGCRSPDPTGDEVLQTLAPGWRDVRLIAHVGNDDDASQARQPRCDLPHFLQRVDLLSV